MTPLMLVLLQTSSYQAGVEAYTKGRLSDAIPLFEKAAAGGEQALVARYMLGTACLEANQDDKAVEAFAALFEARPDSAAAHLLTAQMMLRLKMTVRADKQARRALELDPHIPQAHYILGEAALTQGRSAQAMADLQKEIESNPGFALAYYRLGAAYVASAKWDQAVSALQQSIWLNPNHDGPYLLIARAFLEQGDVDDARAAARHVLELNPGDQAAIRMLEQSQAVRASPHGAMDPAFVRGRTEYLAGHIAAAISLLEKARAAGVHNNELFYMLGNGYLQGRRISQARAAFAELFGTAADSAAARLFTAQMLIRLELEDDAQNELDAALVQDPKFPQAHYMGGEIAIYRAQLDRAAGELGREIALNPGFAMAYYRLGDAYSRREDWEEAVPPLQRAVWLNPTYSGPYILLGKAYFKKGDLQEAERMLRRALQMDPRNASAHYLLGRTLIQAGHAEEGKKLLREWETIRETSGQQAN